MKGRLRGFALAVCVFSTVALAEDEQRDFYAEPGLKTAQVGDRFQFERQGYFCVDKDSIPEKLVFNRTVALRDSWAKIQKKL